MGIEYVGTSGSEEIIFNADVKLARSAAGVMTIGSGAADDAAISSFLELSEITAPSNPATDKGRIYVKDVSGTTKLFFKDSAGTETDILAISEETPGGSDGQVQFNDNTAFGGAAQMYWDDANNRLGIGTSAPNYSLEVAGTGIDNRIYCTGYAATPWINVRRANGTEGSPSAVLDGEIMGGVAFRGHNGTDWYSGAFIRAEAFGDWSGSNLGTYLRFYVTTSDEGGPTLKLQVDDEGRVSTGGETAPDVDAGGLCLNHGANDGKILSFKSSDVAHSVTVRAEADTYGWFGKASLADGGLQIQSISAAGASSGSLHLDGISTTVSNTDTGRGVVNLNFSKHNGTTDTQALADTENGISFRNYSAVKAVIKGSGDIVTQAGIKLGSGGYLQGDEAGAIEWDGSNFRGYNGSAWVNLDTQGGSAAGGDTQVQFNDGGSDFGADTTFTFDKTKEYLKVGTNNSFYQNAGTPYYHGIAVSHTASGANVGGIGVEAVGGLSRLHLYRAGGTIGSLGTVADTDIIGTVSFVGHDGTEYEAGALMRAVVDGTPAANVMPVGLEFMTRESESITTKFRISKDGKLSTGGETAPDVDPGGLCLNHGDNNGNILSFKNSDVAHSFTSSFESDTYFVMRKRSGTGGGVFLRGITEAEVGIQLGGYITVPDTGETSGDHGAVHITGHAWDGVTSVEPLADDDNLLTVANDTNGTLVFVKGSGDIITQAGLKISSYGQSATAGAIQYDGTNFQGYHDGAWVNLDTQGVSSAAGSDGQVQYNNGGTDFGGAAQLYWDDVNNRLGIGTSSPNYKLVVKGDSAFNTAALIRYSSSAADPAGLYLMRARGSEGSESAAIDGDVLGFVGFRAYCSPSGTWVTQAGFQATIDGTISGDNAPTKIMVRTNDGTGLATRTTFFPDGSIATGGETAPDVDPGGLCLNHGDNDNRVLTFKNSDVAHSFTTNAEADTYGSFGKAGSASGGLSVMGLSDGAGLGMHLDAYAMTSNTGATSIGIINLNFGEHNGTTGAQAIADAEVAVSFRNYDTVKSVIYGDGTYETAGDLVVAAAKYVYWGDKSTDGSWRMGRSGDDVILQKRESSSWNTKHTFGD